MEKRYFEFMQDVLISLHENMHELNERKNFAEAAEIAHIDGKLQAYREMLALLRMSGETFGIPVHEIGL